MLARLYRLLLLAYPRRFRERRRTADHPGKRLSLA